MGDKVEKTCPLCAEEMDLTDQQLKPCKCGYEICVWCWHHIMDMAERDNTEGRCPACRKPYDKEKIVGMTANCERLVAKINTEKKLKSQKLKSKTHEGRKHLSSIRVIQRNLVYVIGIPSNLADEDFLQRKEYFGQYGKVLKVSISRTAGGAIQHSSNNTCSVYITYSKEEEAVRCIQSVHDYILEGRSLRACFGTTKYCHAWLRNTPCTNPDCLYLHDIGTQEDSFTKDEIVSAYTRSRIPQINGAANNLLRRSGNVLPPPVDDICNSGTSSGISTVRSAFNNVVSQEKGSSPLGNSGRSITLPAGASWGLRVTNGRPPTAPPACSNEPVKQNPDALSEQSDVIHPNGGLGVSEHYADGDGCTSTVYESKDVQDAASSTVNVINRLSGLRASEDIDDGIKFLSNPTNSILIDRQSHNSTSDKNDDVLMNGNIQILCAGLSSLHMDSHVFVPSNANDCNDPTINHYLSGSPRNQVLEQFHPQYAIEPLSSLEMKTTALDDACISREIPEWVLEPQMQGSKGEVVEDFLTLGEQNLKGSETSHDPLHLPHTSNSFQMRNHSGGFSLQHSNSYAFSNQGSHDLLPAGREIDGPLLPFTSSNSLLSYGNGENKISNHSELDKISEHFNAFSRAEKDKCLGKLNEDLAAFEGHTGVDMGESTIISNILSLDFDPWDEPLASPHYLAKILSENDRQHGSLKLSGSRKLQNSDQSRFSFARQENFVNQGNDFNLSSNVGIMNKYHSHQDYVQNGDVVLNKPQNGFFSNISEGSDVFPSSNSVFSSNKPSAVSRGQISAPPGFSVPVRAPPPGFSATERMDESFSVNQLLESSLFRSQYQMQLNGDQDAGIDVELIDPAILAVGRGRVPSEMNNSSFDMRSTFNSQLCASENERRLQLLMQQSISGQQNHRYFENIGDMFSPLTDPYNADSRCMEQSPFAQLSLQSRNLHTLNGWDGWHEIQRGNDLVMSEILRNEGFALNKNFPGYEGLKFQMSSSGSLYNRAFGM